jgi:hypothetical protein
MKFVELTVISELNGVPIRSHINTDHIVAITENMGDDILIDPNTNQPYKGTLPIKAIVRLLCAPFEYVVEDVSVIMARIKSADEC